MKMIKKLSMIVFLTSIALPAKSMESHARGQGILDYAWNMAKDDESVLVTIAFCASFVAAVYWLDKASKSSLKVYNMARCMVLESYTDPDTVNSKNAKTKTSIAPYQSYWDPQSVTFTVEHSGIQTFKWRHINSGWYQAPVNLRKGEQASLEVFDNGQYKFKRELKQALTMN
ncbi:MAG: hypothetical protein AB7F19_02255 [Candidatus Babeliales bacterium]